MSDEKEAGVPDVDAEAGSDVDVDAGNESDVQVQTPDVDLSAVPEKVRQYVDVEKYSTNDDYRQAIEHGWKPRELHEADGGDEADYTGYRQFNRRYDDKQILKELKEGQAALISSMTKREQEAVAKALAAKEAELAAAIADGDAARAVEINNEITQAKAQPVQQAVAPEPPVVTALRQRNPVLNRQSDQFNEGLNQQFEAECFRLAKDYHESVNYGLPADRRRPLSQLELKSIVNEAFDMIKDRAPQPKQAVAQQRVQPKAPAVSKPAAPAKTSDPKKGLSASALQTYNRLMRAGGKEAADAFAKELAGG